MVEMIKGDKSVKMPALVVVAAVITAGACAIASDVCNVISKRKQFQRRRGLSDGISSIYFLGKTLYHN